MNLFEKSRQTIEFLNRWSGFLSSWLTLMFTVIVSYEVIMRYIFSRPSEWVHYLSAYSFAYLIMLGGGYVEMMGSHIRTDLFYGRLSKRSQGVFDLFFSLCLIFFALVLVWAGVDAFWESFITNRSQVGVLQWPLWPHLIIIPIGAMLLALQGVVSLGRSISRAVG